MAQAFLQGNIEEARRRFADGEFAPAGRATDPIIDSWHRSQASGLSFTDKVIFNPVSRVSQKRLTEHNRDFILAAEADMERLFALLHSGDWAVSLIDARGFVIRSLYKAMPAFKGLEMAFRPGVNLGETAAGTTGPACVLANGRLATVSGREHFLEEAGEFTCTAAPIHAPDGRLIGVLNASRHYRGCRDGIAVPVALTVRAIGEQLVRALPGSLVIELDCPLGDRAAGRGCLAFDPTGRLLGASAGARRLLGLAPASNTQFTELFDETFGQAVDRLRAADRQPVMLTLHNGLQLAASAGAPPPRPRVAAGSAGRNNPLPPEFGVTLSKAQLAFDRDIPILINGDTGTGKEVVARHLHSHGRRAAGPFIALNCSSIPASLIESELFGYEAGAFTGAARAGMPGKLELANGGTLFLDEIGDMPVDLQTRLLRVLQERRVYRVGSQKERELDFSLVSATHRDLPSLITGGLFREDLYYRINGLRLKLPALRERSDFDRLVDRVVGEESGEGKPATLGDAARQVLRRHAWPGNLRELRQALRLACAMAGDGLIAPDHLPPEIAEPEAATLSPAGGALEVAEREVFARKYAAHRGNIAAVARSLGLARATVYKKLRDYRLI